MMPTLKDGLKRGEKRTKQKKRIRPMSKKRERENREYLKRRRVFLLAHPYCQAIERITEYLLDTVSAREYQTVPTPLQLATEVHHMKKPKCKYLLDETTWLAVCRWSHDWIEGHKDQARAIGLLAP